MIPNLTCSLIRSTILFWLSRRFDRQIIQLKLSLTWNWIVHYLLPKEEKKRKEKNSALSNRFISKESSTWKEIWKMPCRLVESNLITEYLKRNWHSETNHHKSLLLKLFWSLTLSHLIAVFIHIAWSSFS